MKLVRFEVDGVIFPGLIDQEGLIRNLSEIIKDIDGNAVDQYSLQKIRSFKTDQLPLVSKNITLRPCIANVGKVVGVALNYLHHAMETGSKLPAEPQLFIKATSAITGPNNEIILPPKSEKLDWEVELGVIIGKTARYITQNEALEHIAGYCVVDDVSERAFQLERGGQQHSKGKSADTFCPIGPWFVTSDEVTNPQLLNLWTKVNGRLMQNGSTKDMIFSVVELISYISEYMTLEPGDIVITGTPEGVGKGQVPPIYLKVGDRVELGVEGLGTQHHKIVSYKK